MTTNEEMRASIRGSVRCEDLKLEIKGDKAGLKTLLTQIVYQMGKQGIDPFEIMTAANIGFFMLGHDAEKERMNEHAD